jgi:hypothetical protein
MNLRLCIFALDSTEGELAAWHIEQGHFTNRTNNKNEWQ